MCTYTTLYIFYSLFFTSLCGLTGYALTYYIINAHMDALMHVRSALPAAVKAGFPLMGFRTDDSTQGPFALKLKLLYMSDIKQRREFC